MERAVYTVVPYESAWGIASGTEIAGPYVSKEAALEAALGPAMNAVKLGFDVRIMVPGNDDSGSALSTV